MFLKALMRLLNAAELMPGNASRTYLELEREQAFCTLLERLNTLWLEGCPPRFESRLAVVAAFAADLRTLGPANFLFADDDVLFAHGDRRLQRSGRAERPGLWMRQHRCQPDAASADQGAGVAVRTDSTSVIWVASVPLTDDPWEPLACGELVAIRGGEIVSGDRPVGARNHAL